MIGNIFICTDKPYITADKKIFPRRIKYKVKSTRKERTDSAFPRLETAVVRGLRSQNEHEINLRDCGVPRRVSILYISQPVSTSHAMNRSLPKG